MEDARRVQISKPVDNLVAERPDDLVLKLAIFPQYTSDRTSGYVLQEATYHVSFKDISSEAVNSHAKRLLSLLKAKVLHDMRVV
jgi:hypothetical protein